MSILLNDEHFADLFKESIASDYKDALLFMNVNPDISLMKFRKILEALCLQYADRYNYKFANDNLYEQIEALSECSFISGINKKSFHEVRELTNTGVHIKTVSKEELVRNAITSRKGILNLLEHAFLDLKLGNSIPSYEMKYAGGQEQKNLWFSCLHSSDYSDHFQLGEIYRKLAEAFERLSFNDSFFKIHADNKFNLAAECYKSAFHLCTKKSIDSVLKTSGKGIAITPYSYSSLFSYVLLCVNDNVKIEDKAVIKTLLHILVNREYSAAYAYLGWSYYADADYKKAYKYLTHKKGEQNAFALHKLGILNLEGKACAFNIQGAVDYFSKAAGLECAESMFELGKLYHKGEFVKKNDVLAKDFLQKAIIRGNENAAIYFDESYLKFKETILEVANQFSATFNDEIQKAKRLPYIATNKIGRNKLCPCSSGKKFKICCGKYR
jgi:hypothetical protein